MSRHDEVKIEASEAQIEQCKDILSDAPFTTSSLPPPKGLLKKIDIRLPPILAILYLLSYIDRANIGNAKIEGMQKDLHLSDHQYNVVLSVFFATYIFFEIPSSFVMERYFTFRPSYWLAILATGWGVMMTLHGIVHQYGGIITVRLLMGMFEAGFFPASVAYMGKWYTKYELASRVAIFYIGSALSGAFSGLLAYGIAKMDGVGGLEGWRWIFILEGMVTAVFGGMLPWILTDTPDSRPKWLSSEEIEYLIDRKTVENGGQDAKVVHKHLNRSILWTVVSDWQYYPLAMVSWSNAVPTYGLKFTLPQIIKNMGYSSSNAQLLTVPPYIAGAISSYGFSLLSDKFKRRAYFLLVPQTILLIAYSVLTALAPKLKDNIAPCYLAIVLANIGCYPINPGASTWCSNNTAPSAKRSIALAYLLSLSNIGGIIASYIYIQSEAPAYPTGFGTSLGFAVLGAVAVIVLEIAYMKINEKRDQADLQQIAETYTEEQLADMGNKSPLFRYTL